MYNSQLYFLRPNVMGEPLVDGWYAWAHLIPPATAARNIAERHLRIMESYINSSESHALAVKDPRLKGGPFMDFDQPMVEEVKELRDRTRTERSHMLHLSSAISDLDEILRSRATGHSLEPLYDEIPEPLRGYAELVYDLNNQPSFRLLESLLYRSKYYDRSMQSILFNSISGDDRPFVLSTPRLADPSKGLNVSIPFDSDHIERLFELITKPARFSEIKELFQSGDESEELLMSFLTQSSPPPYEPYQGPGVRWRYFGHACILIEVKGLTILLDPVLSYTYESNISRYTYEDLPDRIDFVLITHNHQDHILIETLLRLRHRIRTVVVPRNNWGALQDPSLKLILKHCGFTNVVEVSELDELDYGEVSITAIPFLGEHADLNIVSKSAYLLRVSGHSLLFAADACNIDPHVYEKVYDLTGPIDVLFLGMECDGAPMSWIYGALLTRKLERKQDQSRRLAGSNFDRGIQMVEQFRCREVYVYAMGQEPWLNHVMKIKYTEHSNPIVQSSHLIQVCQAKGILAERLFGEKEILMP